MNCKPGDLARVVDSGVNRNRLVWVLDSDRCDPGEWRCRTLQTMVEYVGDKNTGREIAPGSIVWSLDSSLRPIRDPGDDAVDEMVQKVGAPTRDEVHA